MADDTTKNDATNQGDTAPGEKIKQDWNDFLSGSYEFFKKLIDLKIGLDREGTIVNIKNNKRMQGANAWLLMCSIMIASLGLDLNSPAVIIGAMLISPLMSPILGVGLAIGINDKNTLAISIRHFGISIAIAIVTSTIYFKLTPIGNETDEIIARTAPTLLDVMVAFFGGIAGIISGSRKDKSNAIPGVAIATALMPPLCVTGYGIANGNWAFTANSFYLFFLNATFVALATFLIVRLLDFPVRKHQNEKESKKTRWIILAFSLAMILPSGYIFSKVIKQSRQTKSIKLFVDRKFPLALYNIERINNSDSVNVNIARFLSDEAVDALRDSLQVLGIKHCKLNFLKDSDSQKAIEELRLSRSSKDQFIEKSRIEMSKQELEIAQLNFKIDSLLSDTLVFRKMSDELKILFPDLESFSLSNQANFVQLDDKSHQQIPVLYVKWKTDEAKGRAARQAAEERERILVSFVKERVDLDSVMVTRHGDLQ